LQFEVAIEIRRVVETGNKHRAISNSWLAGGWKRPDSRASRAAAQLQGRTSLCRDGVLCQDRFHRDRAPIILWDAGARRG
jgi:hypothetical protein